MTHEETDTGLSEVHQCGEAIYRERLQSVLEPEHNGEAIAIEVESGDYVIDRSWAVAVRRLREQKPDGYVFARFIGPATPAENALTARLTTNPSQRIPRLGQTLLTHDVITSGETTVAFSEREMDEMVDRALAFYQAELKPQLEPTENGKAVAIHVPTGDYSVGKSHSDARRLLRERHAPDGGVVTMTIGPPIPVDIEMAGRFLAGSNLTSKAAKSSSNRSTEMNDADYFVSYLIPDLILRLKDDDVEIRFSAAHDLNCLGVATAPIVFALAKALKDSECYIRCSAASTLENMGDAAIPVIPSLIEALTDSHSLVRASVARTLGNLGVAAASAVHPLAKGLEDEDPSVRAAVAGALRALGSTAESAIPALGRSLKDSEWEARLFVAEAITQIIHQLLESDASSDHSQLATLHEYLDAAERTMTDWRAEEEWRFIENEEWCREENGSETAWRYWRKGFSDDNG